VSHSPSQTSSAGLYAHIPFCVAKCRYCDFSSFADRQTLFSPYWAALLRQIEVAQREAPWPPFDTLYVGGGTPTVLTPEQLCTVVATCARELGLPGNAEVTCEANPGTVSQIRLAALRDGGFNRLSLGVQSLDANDLAIMGRIHDASTALRAFEDAREAGFRNINLDLIYGVPHQSLAVWRRTLEQVLALRPEHLSLYARTLEPDTPLAHSVACGALPGPDDDLAADMYVLAQELLTAQGYAQYEISNWARTSPKDNANQEPALASRHNLHYWHNDCYLGIGSAAHSFDGRRRYGRCADPAEFIRRVQAEADTVDFTEAVDRDLEMDETMMLGLRLMRGVTWEQFRARFGQDLGTVYQSAISRTHSAGLLEVDDSGIRLARNAYLLGNRVFAEFLRSRP
jgi:oxygen-independent coproporphyrinogen-3 oxidase